MSASPLSPGAEMGNHWQLSSGASSPRSDTSSNTNSLFSSPDSPADTELSFPSLGANDAKELTTAAHHGIAVMPSFANHVLVGNKAYAPGQIRVMADVLLRARKTGEFPTSTATTEDPQSIIEDCQHLQRLRDIRGDLSQPPPEKYVILKVDIARRIKARDEAYGAPAKLQEVDHRVQNWMSSINKEARMLEITQAALQRKGINNPTQDDLDAIAEEFMQIAERTLLDVANPLRMNTTRLAGNIDRFDSQLDGLSSINDAVSASMTSQINTLSTMLGAQANTFNGSVGMLNKALTTVTTDLHQLSTNLPAIIAAAVQAAVKEQLSPLSHQHFHAKQHQSNYDQPPGYATATRMQQYRATGGEHFGGGARAVASAVQVSGQESGQESGQALQMGVQPTKSRFKRFFRAITRRGQSKKEAGSK
ncbi:hypothetical protein COL5a_005217 [Colletotrichum fioriniae]|nr:uncharacterized protein COL516b_005972 [Colletotrichum fioriniae]KAJ0304082.1 hypothetical protein COL516b_005972 [Colletotrichum fioriniae]KAJ0328013.1 hypothetical protein COL5a_005217 [Colletotrichum fioriniae]